MEQWKQTPTSANTGGIALPAGLAGTYAILISFTQFFLPVFFEGDLGFSGAQIGLLYAGLSITSVIASFPAGLSTDRITPRMVILGSLILLSAASAGLGIVRSFWVYLLVFILFGTAINVFQISLYSHTFKILDPERRGRGIGAFMAVRMIGFGLGTLGGGYLLMLLDFPKTLLLLAGGSLVMAAVCLALPRLPAAKTTLSEYRADFLRPKVLLFALWLFLFSSHWGAENTSYGLFLKKNLDLSLVGMGWYMTLEFVMFSATAYVVGVMGDRGRSLSAILIAGLLLSGVGHLLMVIPILPVSLFFRALHGIGDGAVSIVMYLGVMRMFLPERIGGNSGIVGLILMSGTLVGALVFGPMGEHFGYALPLIVSGAVTLALIPFPLVAMKRKRAGQAADPVD